MVATLDTQMKRRRQERQEGKNWLVEAIGIGVMLACVVMLVAAAHAVPVARSRIPVRPVVQDVAPAMLATPGAAPTQGAHP